MSNNGDTPIAGWFIMEKTSEKNGFRGAPMAMEPPYLREVNDTGNSKDLQGFIPMS